MHIRNETEADIPAIRALVSEAFAGMAYSSQTEAAIVDALRRNGTLSVSLVAEDESGDHRPHRILTRDDRWRRSRLVRSRSDCRHARKTGSGNWQRAGARGACAIRKLGAQGCVLVGEPSYYGRFGFSADGRLRFAGVPPNISRH